MNKLTVILSALSALASTVALVFFYLLTMRLIEKSAGSTDYWGPVLYVAVVWPIVLTPYAILIVAARMASTLLTSSMAFAAAALCTAIGAFGYSGAFQITDGEYFLMFMLVPPAQAAFATVALIASVIVRRRNAL